MNTLIYYIQNLTKKIITEGIELILNNNSFHFDNRNDTQTLGTTMGTKSFEENLREIIGKIFNENIQREFTKLWKRYLDDCFIFWNYIWGKH